jgi:hypothetical protein
MWSLYLGGKSVLSFVSVENLNEEVNRQIDYAIEAIPLDAKSYSDYDRWTRFLFNNLNDFLLGYEVGYIIHASMTYHKDQVRERGIRIDEKQEIEVRKDIETAIVDRLLDIQQAILKAFT